MQHTLGSACIRPGHLCSSANTDTVAAALSLARVWSNHQTHTLGVPLTCPLCRSPFAFNWSPPAVPVHRASTGAGSSSSSSSSGAAGRGGLVTHPGVTCSACKMVGPVGGRDLAVCLLLHHCLLQPRISVPWCELL
jgi:hypothetical protein